MSTNRHSGVIDSCTASRMFAAAGSRASQREGSTPEIASKLEGVGKKILCIRYGLNPELVKDWNSHQLAFFCQHKDKSNMKAEHIAEKKFISSKEHVTALNFLITVKKFSIMDAMAVVEDLQPFQAQGISWGLTKQELVSLKPGQVQILRELKCWGMTSEMLQANTWLMKEQQLSGILYALEQGQTLEVTLQSLQGLEDEAILQAQTFQLTFQEVKGLNRYQCQALALKTASNGVIDTLFRDWIQFDNEAYLQAFSFLVKQKGYKGPEAKIELSGMNKKQALLLSCGKPRDNIMDLTDFQLQVIESLECKGMSGTLLRKCHWFNHPGQFMRLKELVFIRQLPLLTALDEVSTLNRMQCELLEQYSSLSQEERLSKWRLQPDEIVGSPWLATEKYWAMYKKLLGYQFIASEVIKILNAYMGGNPVIKPVLLGINNQVETCKKLTLWLERERALERAIEESIKPDSSESSPLLRRLFAQR